MPGSAISYCCHINQKELINYYAFCLKVIIFPLSKYLYRMKCYINCNLEIAEVRNK